MGNSPVKLLDRLRECIRLKGYSIRTEKTYVSWVKQFILFHDKRHPQEMGKPEIESFLSHLVSKRNVASSTQNRHSMLYYFSIAMFLPRRCPKISMRYGQKSLCASLPL